MKFSYNWLKELSGTKKSPEQLAEILALRTFEVEGMEPLDIARGKRDAILDIKILADRGHDCLSHIGMAREIAVIESRQFKYLGAKLLSKKSGLLKVEIKDKKLCSRYIGAVMTNIKIQPSPKWMQERLIAAGLRPINNIVDATNYVMLETGQPMHAFDKNKLTTNNKQLTTILIRKAKKGEKIKLLDGGEKILTSEDLVIADSEKVLAIAGIKGGAEAEINNNTRTIILEAANFNAVAIRKSRMRLGLKTDSSDRFEKEIDPNLAETAMARAVGIIGKFGGKLEGMVDVYPKKAKPWKIKLDLNYVSKLLGEKISTKTIVRILNSLGVKTRLGGSASNWRLSLQVPTFRIDLKTQEDLIEEIGRIYGYEKIKPQAPLAPVQTPPVNNNRLFERQVKNILAGKGFSEVYNYSFYGRRNAGLAELGTIEHLELENPMNPDQVLMRVSLIPGILKNIAENLKRYEDIMIFEIGRAYWSASVPLSKASAGKSDDILPEEERMLVGAVVLESNVKAKSYLPRRLASLRSGQAGKLKAESFYKAKGYIDALMDRLGIDDYYYDTFDAAPADTPITLWHQGRSAAIKIEGSGEEIGYLGEINPLVLANFDIHQRAAVFEFDLEKLRKTAEAEREYEPIRKYPEVVRDISLIAPQGILVDEILQTIQKAGGNLVLDVDLFDIFDFADGSSSYAFHIIFGADNRTLKSGEVDKLMEKIISSLEKELGVKVRK